MRQGGRKARQVSPNTLDGDVGKFLYFSLLVVMSSFYMEEYDEYNNDEFLSHLFYLVQA